MDQCWKHSLCLSSTQWSMWLSEQPSEKPMLKISSWRHINTIITVISNALFTTQNYSKNVLFHPILKVCFKNQAQKMFVFSSNPFYLSPTPEVSQHTRLPVTAQSSQFLEGPRLRCLVWHYQVLCWQCVHSPEKKSKYQLLLETVVCPQHPAWPSAHFWTAAHLGQDLFRRGTSSTAHAMPLQGPCSHQVQLH